MIKFIIQNALLTNAKEKTLSSLPWPSFEDSTKMLCSDNHHTIIRAAFVCLFVCSLCTPRSFDGSSPNLVSVCRLTSHLPLRGSFSKLSTGRRVNGSLSLSTMLSLFIYAAGSRHTTAKKHTAYDSRQHQTHATPLTKAHGIFCSLEMGKSLSERLSPFS